MTASQKSHVARLISLFSALVVLGIIIYLSSGFTQSRYVFRRQDGALVFFDKYIARKLRTSILENKQTVTARFMIEARLLRQGDESEPYAYFMADRSYGILSISDPLTQRYMKDALSSDFPMLRHIGTNFFANELVSTSLASSDGRYVFLNPDDNWQESLLHAWVHALAARNIPTALSDKLRPSGDWDFETAKNWRFVDETIALLASDLFAVSRKTGLDQPGLNQAWSNFAAETWPRYNDTASEVLVREKIQLRITFDFPQRSAAYYRAANGFAVYLQEHYGRTQVESLARNFLGGDYTDLDDLFGFAGGFENALLDWQGHSALPG